MANVNLLNQLAGSVAPQGRPFNAAQSVAAGQELVAGNERLALLRAKLDAQRTQEARQAEIDRILQMGGSPGEIGQNIMALDPRMGLDYMKFQQTQDKMTAEQAAAAAEAEQLAAQERDFRNLLGVSDKPPAEQAALMGLWGADQKAAYRHMLAQPESDDVNWTFKMDESGNVMAIHPRTLEVRPTGIKGQDNSFGGSMTLPDGTVVRMGKGGYTAQGDGIPVDPKIGRDIQEQDLKDNKMLADLFRLGQDFMGGGFGGQTYQGRAVNWLLEKADKAGIGNPASDWGENRLKKATRFKQGIEQIFNAYRKEITGAAAAVQELERLKQAMLNADLSPTQFEASYNEFIAKVMRGQKIAAQMVREGYDPSKEEGAEVFDRMWNAGVFSEAEATNYLTLMQNIEAGETQSIPGQGVFASDGEQWIKIRGAE